VLHNTVLARVLDSDVEGVALNTLRNIMEEALHSSQPHMASAIPASIESSGGRGCRYSSPTWCERNPNGAGDMIGVSQTGIPDFRVGDVISDSVLMTRAQNAARQAVASAGDLEREESKTAAFAQLPFPMTLRSPIAAALSPIAATDYSRSVG
jgi:hypothetical protein